MTGNGDPTKKSSDLDLPEGTNLLPAAEIVITGVGEPISRIHGPDESQDLGELRKNIIAEAHAIRSLSEINTE